MSWFPKKSVLVPIDFSDASLETLDVARELVADDGVLHVVFVMQSVHPVEPGIVWDVVTEETRREQVRQGLEERLGKSLEDAGLKLHIPAGNPARQIALVAEANKVDLVVMPSHGRSGLPRFFLGSVTERVLRLSKCPVLVLRIEDDPGLSR